LRHVIVVTLNGASGGPPALHKAKQSLPLQGFVCPEGLG